MLVPSKVLMDWVLSDNIFSTVKSTIAYSFPDVAFAIRKGLFCSSIVCKNLTPLTVTFN